MKDNTNKVDYNVWSCGEYNGANNGFEQGADAIVQPSNEFSTNGEYSIKAIRKSELYGTTTFTRISNLTGTNNITATCQVYSPNNKVKLELNNGSTLTGTICPKSSTVNTISLSTTITSNYVDLRIFLYAVDDYVFIDNIKITY